MSRINYIGKYTRKTGWEHILFKKKKKKFSEGGMDGYFWIFLKVRRKIYHHSIGKQNISQLEIEHVVCVLIAQSRLTLCDPMDCCPPGSFVQGILEARILEWIAFRGSSSGDLPNPRIEPWSPILQVDSLPAEPPGKPIWLSHFAVRLKHNPVN